MKCIEIQILNVKEINKDNGFSVRVLMDNEEKSVLELEKDDMLHIGAILLNASRKFINNADKLSNYGRKI